MIGFALFVTAVILFGVGLPFACIFGISTLIPRLRWRHPRTPAAMLAYSMLHPSTRDDWVRGPAQSALDNAVYANAKLGATVTHGWHDCMGVGFPISNRDERLLRYAVRQHRKRETERQKMAALEAVVAKFEEAYGTNN